MNNNHLTLVLTTYNRLKMIEKMVDSIRKQTDLNFDLIICDNHSTDGSWEYIEHLEKFNNGNFVKLHWQENLGWAGSAAQWNQYIQTEWTSILSDDDWLGDNFVLTSNTAIATCSSDFSGLIILGHKCINEKDNLEKEHNHHTQLLNVNEGIRSFFFQKFNVAGISGFLLKSEILKEGFPKYYEGVFLEDTMIICRSILKGGIFFCNGIHYFRREGHESLGNLGICDVLYLLVTINFQKDLNIYMINSSCESKLRKRVLRYTTYDHIKSILRVIIYRQFDLSHLFLYVKRVKNVNQRRYYEALLFFPVLVMAYFFKKVTTQFKR